ncbi:MAG: MFS transporter [Chloroflexi bacterium]|nr:MFS transporter [Chloroflexota bacterium]
MKKLLKNKNFLLLWIGQSVSETGNWINFIALNALIYKTYGSGKMLGLFLALRLISSLVFSSLGGIISDRYPRKTVIIICNLLSGVLVPAFIFNKQVAVFFIIGFVLSSLNRIFTAAYSAYMPQLVEKEDILNANSLRRTTSSLLTVIAPGIAGLLIAVFSYKIAFIIDSGTFFFAVICFLLIHRVSASSSDKIKVVSGIGEEFKATYEFLVKHGLILSFFFLRLLDALGSGAYNTALPVFSRGFSKAVAKPYGFLISAWGLGALMGSLLAPVLEKKLKLKRNAVYIGAVLLMAAGMGATFFQNDFYVSLLLILLGGIGDGITAVLFTSLLMEDTPDSIRGKVFGFIQGLIYSSAAIGMAVSGFFVEIVALKNITAAGSVLIIAGVLAVLAWGKVKNKTGEKQLS